MSELEVEISQALLPSRWLPSRSPPWLLKYAPHPHRPGYIFLLTDLSSLYLEVLTAPSVPSRLHEVDRTFSDSGKKGKGKGRRGNMDGGDVIRASEEALGKVGEMMRRWEGVEMEVREHDYHDKVVAVSTDDFAWLFNMTELKGREALRVLSQHLIAPLARCLAQNQGVDIGAGPQPIDPITQLFGNAKVAAQVAGLSSERSGKSKKVPEPGKKARAARKTRQSSPPAANFPSEELEEPGHEEEEEYKSPSASSERRSAAFSSTSLGKSGSHDLRPSREPLSRKSSARTRSPSDEEMTSVGMSRGVSGESEGYELARAKPVQKRAVRRTDEEDEEESEADNGDGGEEGEKGDVPRAAMKKMVEKDAPLKPIQSSEGSKRQKEAEEDEVERRLKEMKRKMEHGGGGRLGKRRTAR